MWKSSWYCERKGLLVRRHVLSVHGHFLSVHRHLLSVHRDPLSVHRDPLFVHGDPVSVHGDPIFVHGDPIFVHGDPIFVHEDPVSVHRDPVSVHRHFVSVNRHGPFVHRRFLPGDENAAASPEATFLPKGIRAHDTASAVLPLGRAMRTRRMKGGICRTRRNYATLPGSYRSARESGGGTPAALTPG
jgi:hypothetical protein